MTYKEKLKDPRWQKKRLKILERDNWKCRCCTDDLKMLVVHHLVYYSNRDPWEYEDDELITFCEDCHEYEHALQILARVGIHLSNYPGV